MTTTLSIITTPYEGDSARLHHFCLSEDLTFTDMVEEDELFNMELVVFYFENEDDYKKAQHFYENYI